jgi:NAD(P)-dependent dehydrogenase (short-subunit alcohol dehydrogenase family)
MPAVIVIGAGPGIGASVARRFAREGFDVGVIARSRATVDAARASVAETAPIARGAIADAADETGLRRALDELTAEIGLPDALVYNAALLRGDSIADLTTAQHLEAWSVDVVGAIHAAAHVLPRMAERGHGTFLITGGMPVALPGFVSLSLGKAGVRALTELLDAQFGAAGVHVATVTVGGAVSPGGAFDPDDIAERYWQLHRQAPGSWEREVRHGGGS